MNLKKFWSDKSLHKRNAWADIVFVHPFSLPLSKFLARYYVNPNLVTISTVPINFLAALMFATNNLILGALLFWLGYILDGTDGELARLTNTQSKFGSKLDARCDVLNHFMLYTGLFYSQYYLIDQWFNGFLLISIHYFVTVFGIIFIYDTSYKTFSPRIFSYFSSFEEGFFTFLIGPLFNIVRLTLFISIFIQVLTHSILFIKRGKRITYKEFKTRVKRSLFRVIE